MAFTGKHYKDKKMKIYFVDVVTKRIHPMDLQEGFAVIVKGPDKKVLQQEDYTIVYSHLEDDDIPTLIEELKNED